MPGPARPIIMTSVAVIAIWARLVRTIGQLSESVARISSRQGDSGARAPASIADIFLVFQIAKRSNRPIFAQCAGESLDSSRSPAASEAKRQRWQVARRCRQLGQSLLRRFRDKPR